MNKTSKIYIAGHKGLVGSAIMRLLLKEGYSNIIVRSKDELDLRNQEAVDLFFKKEKPEFVFLAAAMVGGIIANSRAKASFFYDNSMIALNVIHSAYKHKTAKLLNLGSSCIYPKLAPQPLREEYLLSGALEETNDAYALAKISAIKMCSYYNKEYETNFISAMPTNLFGYYDNFDLMTSHVLPAIIRKIDTAKRTGEVVQLWGDGTAKREFLFSDDLALALLMLMENKNATEIGEFVNIGAGKDLTIKELSLIISEIIGYKGEILWDTSKPNGTPQKLLDISRITNLGWKPVTTLTDGIRLTYEWYCRHAAHL